MLFFHLLFLGQAHWRKIQDLGLSTDYVDNGKVRTFIWKVLALPHVPLERHPEAVRHIRNSLSYFQDQSQESPSHNLLYRKLQQYWESGWWADSTHKSGTTSTSMTTPQLMLQNPPTGDSRLVVNILYLFIFMMKEPE